MSRLEMAAQVATGLNFPSAIAFDDDGVIFIAESGLALGGAQSGGRILRVETDRRFICLKDELRAPVNGLTYHRGLLYIAEGGNPGRISVLNPKTGDWAIVLDGLPGGGNYHTNNVAFGPDGKLYFGQGSATNSGIVGPDSLELSWLRKLEHPHDIPGYDVVLTGADAAIDDESGENPPTITGAFQPYGTPTKNGQWIQGRVPCTSAVMRCDRNGANLELVAWGLRNPFGLSFLPNGRLLAIDLGMNDRGSRPVGNGPSALYEVRQGCWYGWPDFAAGVAVTDPSLTPSTGASARFLLNNHHELGPPCEPLIHFEPREAPTRFAPIPGTDHLIVTLFGDKRPVTGPPGPKAGRRLVKVGLDDRSIVPLESPIMHRPIDIARCPATRAFYVVDFGEFELESGGRVNARQGTGAVWRLTIA